MFFKAISCSASRSSSARSRRSSPKFRPALAEALEGRLLLSGGYFAYNLGTLGGANAEAHAINTAGQVVGRAETGGTYTLNHPQPIKHAFLWDKGTMVDLGSLLGPAGLSAAWGINDAGQVVGMSDVRLAGSAYPTYRAFLVTPDDTDGDGKGDRWFRDDNADQINDLMRDLGSFGGNNSDAYDINNAGQVVGWALNAGNIPKPFVWQDGVMTALPTLFEPGGYSYAYSINDAGVVVGLSGNGFGIDHAFRWTSSGGTKDVGGMYAQSINNSGAAVGGSRTPQWYNAVTWGPNATSPTLLGTLAGDNGGFANGINDHGDIVGVSSWAQPDPSLPFASRQRAFLLSGGVMRDLDELAPAAEDWTFASAKAINNAGQVVGSGRTGVAGPGGAFLLSPTDLNLPLLSIADASLVRRGGGASAVFEVTLSAASSKPVSVKFSTADGSAVAGTHYLATSGTVTFNPGETSKSVVVPLLVSDPLAGDEKTFQVTLGPSSNAAFADAQAAGATGLFAPAVLYPLPGADGVASHDFNGDGRPDLVATSGGTQRDVTVLLSAGDGTFKQQVSTPVGGGVTGVVFGDLNADGKPDLAVTSATSRVIGYGQDEEGYEYPIYTIDGFLKVLLGDGDGSFTQAGATRALGERPPSASALSDFDNDGDLDLVLTDFGLGSVSVLLGSGGGSFAATPLTTAVTRPSDVQVADVDSDGAADLILVSAFESVAVLLGKGDGTFHPPQTAATNITSKAVGDINADGKLDLIVGSVVPVFDDEGYHLHDEGYVNVLRGNGDGTFAVPADGNRFFAGLGMPLIGAVADVSGDGKADVVTAGSVLRGNGDGTLRPAEAIAPAYEPVVVDLNGDGLLDIASAGSGGVVVLIQRAGPSLAGDADLDGDVDLDDVAKWSANFTGALPRGTGTKTWAQGDWDGDGDVDLDDVARWSANFTGALAGGALGVAGPVPIPIPDDSADMLTGGSSARLAAGTAPGGPSSSRPPSTTDRDARRKRRKPRPNPTNPVLAVMANGPVMKDNSAGRRK